MTAVVYNVSHNLFFNVYISTQVPTCFLIKFPSSYLSYEIRTTNVMLHDSKNIVKPVVPENLLWWIHTQPDGTFTVETYF